MSRSQRIFGDGVQAGVLNESSLSFAPGSLVPSEISQGSIVDPWDHPVQRLVEQVSSAVDFYNGFLDECEIDASIDEIAVMFQQREQMWGWLQAAVSEPNVRIFNHARDSVNTSPVESRYAVEYTFLETSALPWRIEAMLITDGHSPLHHSIAANRVGGTHIVHASFKCLTTREWRKAVAVLNEEAECVQRCKSIYGRFGYWTLEESARPSGIYPLYLKPRLNERDA